MWESAIRNYSVYFFFVRTSFIVDCIICVKHRRPESVLNSSWSAYTSANSMGLENRICAIQSLVYLWHIKELRINVWLSRYRIISGSYSNSNASNASGGWVSLLLKSLAIAILLFRVLVLLQTNQKKILISLRAGKKDSWEWVGSEWSPFE